MYDTIFRDVLRSFSLVQNQRTDMTVSSIPPSGSSHSDTAKTRLMQGKKGLIMGVANDRSIG